MPAAPLMLEVVAGRHAGVRVQLDADRCCVGSAPDADIMLRDPGVAPAHVRIKLELSGLCVEAAGADVGLGTELLPLGHGCRVDLPAEIILGEAQICVSRARRSGGVLAGGISRLSASTGVRRAIAAGTFIVSLVTPPFTALASPSTRAQQR